MENQLNQNTPQSDTAQNIPVPSAQTASTVSIEQPMGTVYQVAGSGQPEFVQTQHSFQLTERNSIVILILLILTFFTPLGAILFLPLVIAALVITAKKAKQSAHTNIGTPKGLFFSLVRLIIVILTVIGIGIVALIGLFFILLSTGAIDFRMGS